MQERAATAAGGGDMGAGSGGDGARDSAEDDVAPPLQPTEDLSLKGKIRIDLKARKARRPKPQAGVTTAGGLLAPPPRGGGGGGRGLHAPGGLAKPGPPPAACTADEPDEEEWGDFEEG